ncbi:MAG: arginine--tRNA ligase [Deltaproteobacteria bacterium]|nr:arginine--tRNA ligase [Deltaproteobacteria bacterium]
METSPLALATARIIVAALPDGVELGVDEVAGLLAPPPKPELGDLAFPCFRLAKALRKGPPVIATELAQALPTDGLITETRATGPYLNVRLDLGKAAPLVLSDLVRGQPATPPAREQRVMVEYSQPNTHKAFHVGHMRNVCMGDAIVRLLRADGYDVVAANYYGDVGAHIAKCMWWYLDHLDDAGREPPAEGRGEWLGEMYTRANNLLADWADAAKAGDAEAQAKLDAGRARTTDLLQKLESRHPEVAEVWDRTRQWSLDDFAEIYRWCGVEFDRAFYESEVDEPGLALVEEYLQRGIFVESEGAVGIFNEEVKHMPFFMLRKRDGTGLYATKDLALARLKFEEHAIDRSIYVVDTRQSDHFRHVFLTLHKMGFTQAERCEHVPYEVVELPSGPMSGRKGNVILFRALRERMTAHLVDNYLAKYRGQWPDEEIERTAHVVALGAIKFGMLARDVNQKIVFDMESWMAVEGDTGPYLQYSAARTNSILRKAAKADKPFDPSLLDDPQRLQAAGAALVQPEERQLILELAELSPQVHRAADKLRPSTLCTYLLGLAKAINRFSNAKQCHVLRSEGAILEGRLLLVQAAREGMRWGMGQLGIEAPERM